MTGNQPGEGKKKLKFQDLTPIFLSFLKVGAFGFGGGAGMLAMLRSECVKKRKWLSDEDLSVGVALGQMVPGPFVPHYCQYIGNHIARLRGAILATIALLLPSFLLMLLLSYLYFQYHTLPGIEQIFKGIGAVMTAIILWASYDMGKVLIKDTKGIIIFGVALVLFLVKFDPVLTVLICGIFRILLDHVKAAKYLLTVPLLAFEFKKGLALFWIFLKIGAVIFGGGYAAIPFIRNEVCTYRNWLTTKEFLDGVALGQVTPGPIAITATFVGYKAMGIIGAGIATIAIFLPSFLLLLLFMKIYKKVEHNKLVVSFFSGIKSAVIAILLSTGIFFVLQNWLNIPYASLGVVCTILLLFVKIDPLFLIAGGIAFGLVAR